MLQALTVGCLMLVPRRSKTLAKLHRRDTKKPPTTSELINWVRILHLNGKSLDSLAEDPDLPPYWKALSKTAGALDAYLVVALSRPTTARRERA